MVGLRVYGLKGAGVWLRERCHMSWMMREVTGRILEWLANAKGKGDSAKLWSQGHPCNNTMREKEMVAIACSRGWLHTWVANRETGNGVEGSRLVMRVCKGYKATVGGEGGESEGMSVGRHLSGSAE
jgi:hypothetical protein